MTDKKVTGGQAPPVTYDSTVWTDEDLAGKTVLDATCGARSIWFDKNNPIAIYCDVRREDLMGIYGHLPDYVVKVDPDITCDFTDLPFDDGSFRLAVLDPPHLHRLGKNSYIAKRYGRLPDGWEPMLRDGFRECIRVLKPGGVLVFKWSEHEIPSGRVWAAIGERPLFGHRSGKRSNTLWAAFLKPEDPGFTDHPARFLPGRAPGRS